MLDNIIMKKYLNSCEYIRSAVNNGILPPQYLDLTFQWSSDLGRLSTSVEARRSIDTALNEVAIRKAQEKRNILRGKFIGNWMGV